MADTCRGDYPNDVCSDCQEKGGVCFKHWGPLVPRGEVGKFCGDCWQARIDDCRQGRPIRPLGVKAENVPIPLE